MIGLFEGVDGVKAVIMTRISGLDTECEGMVWGPFGLLGRRFGEPPFHRSGTVRSSQDRDGCVMERRFSKPPAKYRPSIYTI